MDFEWERWRVHVASAQEYLKGCKQILTAENFVEVLERLPEAYRHIGVEGNADNSALNKESLLGLLRVLPVAWSGDFYVTSHLWPERKHAGLFVYMNVFKNSYRLTLSFADETVYFKLAKRDGLRYKGFMAGEAVIVDQEDMGQIEKLLQLMED